MSGRDWVVARGRLASAQRALWRSLARDAGILVALGAALSVLAVRTPQYFTYDNFVVIAFQMAFIAIGALGMTLLIVGGTVDLSVGAIFGLAAVTAANLSLHLPVPLAIAFAVALGGAVGMLNGVLVWRLSVSPLIITLGMMTFLQGIVELISGGFTVESSADFPELGQSRPWGIPAPVWIFAGLFVIVYVILHHTTIGRHIYAMGGNRAASLSAGLHVRRLVLGCFLVNGLLVGIAGTLAASYLGTADTTFGLGFEFDVITAVILGGVAFSGGEGHLRGVVLAVLLLGVIQSGIVSLGIDPAWANISKGLVLVAAVGFEQLSHEQRDRYRRRTAQREHNA